jgi:5-methyltetrahydrofolate--homocysteine methyltransferase
MMPNAGMPTNKDGKAVYDMDPREFGKILANMVIESGLAVVGGCCGTTPEHISLLAEMLRGKKCAPRTGARKTYVSTGISGTDLESGKRPFVIGERLNTQGSKKTKELVLAQNFDELYQIAMEQIRKDCRLLDLCVATSERDDDAERRTMQSLVSFLSERVTVPFCIDTTEAAVFASALRACPGSVLINSINLEHAGAKARAILPLAKEFGCPLIALTIDDEGMAKTVGKKIDVARRIVDLACGEFGLPLHFVYIDPLTFTLATGDAESADAAKNSLEALFRLKEEMPHIRTAMGVSNVSYGLKPASRRVLNNLMLHFAAQAGLDAAIFNPLHLDRIETYDPAVRNLGENLLFNRKPEALPEFINAFDDAKARPVQTTSAAIAVSLTLEQDLHNRIVERDRRDLAGLINALLKSHEAQDILNMILLPAMALVGDKMNKGEMILPFVLQAAEIMKEAVAILEPHMAGKKGATRGKIVLATVYGDVHDIGKNLVATILKNQGYEIVDCGRQVPTEEIIAVVKRENPDAVGLSALLVATSREMARFVTELDRLGMTVPVLIGGAAVNRDFAARIARVDSERGRIYAGGVHYAKDAFEAIRVLDTLGKKESSREQPKQVPLQSGKTPKNNAQSSPKGIEHPEIVHPHFYGTSQVLRWDAEALLAGIDAQRLFKGYFGGGNLDEKAFLESREKEFVPVFEELKKEIITGKLIDASGLYGIFPVYTDDKRLFILDPDDFHTQRAEFLMPRVERKQNRSIADYFRPDGDTIGVQIVTIGKAIDERCRSYFGDQNRYSRGFYLNAIANYLTEQLADKVSMEIRRALLIPPDRGRRYSFGYPGLPGVEEQTKLFDVLGVEERLGVTLTPGFQMVPEHSTMGIFVHHPDAEYL